MNIFTRHPFSVGMTYYQHLCFSFRFSLILLKASSCSFIHGIFPFLFETTITDLNNILTRKLDSRKYEFVDKI